MISGPCSEHLSLVNGGSARASHALVAGSRELDRHRTRVAGLRVSCLNSTHGTTEGDADVELARAVCSRRLARAAHERRQIPASRVALPLGVNATDRRQSVAQAKVAVAPQHELAPPVGDACVPVNRGDT